MYGFLFECKKIEENAHQTYRLLAKNDQYPEKLREVFLSLSDDENGHARAIDLAMQANKEDLDVTPFISWEKITEAKSLSDEFLCKAQRTLVAEEDSLRMAIEMEQVFVKIHIQNALHFNDKNLLELFQALEDEDQKHIETLKDCLKWWHSTRS